MTDETTTQLYCYRHPQRETRLRCNRCEQPICSECAVLTPTGYRCVECVRSQQKVFETAEWYDYPLAILIAGVLSFIGSLVASFVGFFTLFIAPVAGVIIAEAVRWVIKRRRSKLLFRVVTASAIVGSLPYLLISLVNFFLIMNVNSSVAFTGFLPLIWRGLYTFLMASSLYYRISGIRL